MNKPNFYLRKPNQRRRIFSIFKRTTFSDGRTLDETLKLEDMDAVNSRLAAKTVDLLSATRVANQILNRLKAESGQTVAMAFNSQNEKVLKAYLTEYFRKKRNLVDRDSARYKFERAIKALEELSIEAATSDQILDKIDKHDFNDNKKREVIHKLNSILKHLGRNIVLPTPHKEFNHVKHLTAPELELVVGAEPDESLKILYRLLFYSGLRIGEALALTRQSKQGRQHLYIDKQIDKTGKIRLPKNRKKRKAFLFKAGVAAFEAWLTVENFNLSRDVINKRFKKACKDTFKDSNRRCKLHDLRHSYAIALLSKGVSLSLVAQSLGNSIAVCQEYYTGFELSDESISQIGQILHE